MKKVFLLLCVALLFQSCAQSIVCEYQKSADNTGTIRVQPTGDLEQTSVLVNGNVMVKKKAVKDITIKNVPKGENKLVITSASPYYVENIATDKTVTVEANAIHTELVNQPKLNGWYWALVTIPTVVLVTTLLVTK